MWCRKEGGKVGKVWSGGFGWAWLGAAVLLSGCAPQGGGSGVSFTQDALAGAKAFSDLGSLPDTATASMPTTGSATYSGGTEMRFFSAAGESYVLIGDTSVSVDFSGGTLSGTMAGFRGGVAPVGAAYPVTAADYSGSIGISNGTIGATRPSGIAASFDGSLTGAGNLITANGGLLGDFKGSPVQGIVGVGAGVVTLNGGATTGAILNLWAR